VTVAGALDADQAINVQDSIDAGELPGASIESGELVAVAATEGLVTLDGTTLGRVDAYPSDAPVTAVVKVEGPAEPTLYATTGSHLMRIEVKEGQAASARDDVWMPAPVHDLVLIGDAAHPRPGRSPLGGPTVCRRAPRQRGLRRRRPPPNPSPGPSTPRRASDAGLRAAATTCVGEMSAIETGQNAFGWRFPGVILGAFTAGLLYLLARMLFRRRPWQPRALRRG
jgi:hypothetical protein